MAKEVSSPNASSPLKSAPLFEAATDRVSLVGQFLWGCFWLGVTGFGLYLKPSLYLHGTHEELGLPPCPSVLLFNRPCPGCGLTTSFTALLHGDFHQAFEAHPLGPFLYLLLAVTGIAAFYGFATRQRFSIATPKMTKFLTVVMVVFLAFGAYRFATTPNYQSPTEHQYQIVF